LNERTFLTFDLKSMVFQAEEPVDQKANIEKSCHKPCSKEWDLYEQCKERIEAKGTGSCEPWVFDYWKCIDKCVSRVISISSA
jgi:ubiquinol-cytochrome c reductase subunit 6